MMITTPDTSGENSMDSILNVDAERLEDISDHNSTEEEDKAAVLPTFGLRIQMPSLPDISLPTLPQISLPDISLPDLSQVRGDIVQVKDGVVERIEYSEKVVDNILTETAHGAILDELLFAGNMPVLQEYLLKYSFLGDGDAPSKVSATWLDTAHYFLVSLACCINIMLRGVSQVYLCNNPLSGVMICIGLYLTDPKLLIFALVGTASATLFASLVCLPASTEIVSGLTGYDGALIGCAVASFINPDHTENSDYGSFAGSFRCKGMAITVVLSSLAGFVHMSARHSSALPALTLSFNICMLAFLYTLTDGRSELTSLGWSTDNDDFADDTISDYWTSDNFRFFYDATIRGVGQFMFIGNTVGAWMVVIGIAITSRTAAFASVVGSFTACWSARYIFAVPQLSLVSVHNGLYGYCAAGVCVSIGGGVFYHASPVALAIGILGAIFCVFIQLAVEAILYTDELPLPALTIPFVFTTWFMMLSRSAWLDPKSDEGEDMDDVLFKKKDRKRNRLKTERAPSRDDPDEKWNTRDKSQMKRRESLNATLSKPFVPLIRKISSSKLLKADIMIHKLTATHTERIKEGATYALPPENVAEHASKIVSTEEWKEASANNNDINTNNTSSSFSRNGSFYGRISDTTTTPDYKVDATTHSSGVRRTVASSGSTPPIRKLNSRKIAVVEELEDI